MQTPHLFKTTVLAAFLATTLPLAAQGVWLPRQGELVLSPSTSFQSYDEFRVGKQKMILPADIEQQTSTLQFEYGITPRLALDATIGYTEVSFEPPGGPEFTREGRDDTRVGLRYLIAEETADVPALALRVGAIIAGGYDVPNTLPPINPGDDASGAEFSLSAGKVFGATGFGAYGELGYRTRNNGVPDDLFGSLGLFKQFGPVSLNVGYRHSQGLSGGDIGGEGFGTDYGFPQVKEIASLVEAGISYADGGGRTYSFFVAQKVGGGRNTGGPTILGVSIGLPFKLTP